MAKTILAFAASNSSVSINRQLVNYAASLIDGADIETLDIHDYEMPIYRHDREEADGIPQLAHDFLARIAVVDALVVSVAEHNGSYAAAFKNIFDWCSRVGREVWQNKPMVLLSTSPGPGAAGRVLAMAETAAPHFGGNVLGTLAVPKFDENFDSEEGVLTNASLDADLRALLAKL
ncbi:NAD(P)H-dependent oxidoreductase [Pontixanthobacter sp. CEM42]|uniref:NADPH-dependent FMN reductase n=1 Tax=Pontixanthobacter sp. CEM42 TaxID=2792077 RepID=UPI001AE0DA95|nr:NAD(P)H-dependent oxidoreductase [Pontixanthobacter sp. CEM42]